MPTYLFKCDVCDNEMEKILKIDNRNDPVGVKCQLCNGHLVRVMTSVPIGDAVRLGFTKPPSQMKDVLQRIHERTPGSKIKDNSTLTKI